MVPPGWEGGGGPAVAHRPTAAARPTRGRRTARPKARSWAAWQASVKHMPAGMARAGAAGEGVPGARVGSGRAAGQQGGAMCVRRRGGAAAPPIRPGREARTAVMMGDRRLWACSQRRGPAGAAQKG